MTAVWLPIEHEVSLPNLIRYTGEFLTLICFSMPRRGYEVLADVIQGVKFKGREPVKFDQQEEVVSAVIHQKLS